MDKFRTEVQISSFPFNITYDDSVVLIGSCFSDNMGNKLIQHKFDTLMNPFGVLYNPVSVANGLELLMAKKLFSKEDLLKHNGLWHSFYHHSSFSDPDADQCLCNVNRAIADGYQQLKKAQHLFVTFGTAWVFEYITSGQIVSNCHKIPAQEFNRYSLSISEIGKIYAHLLKKLQAFNPGLNIVFTVSPIRHWKDGPIENQRSKSTLLLAVAEICKAFDFASYFPSYEIMMDDLRDYRFYASDMVHPNEVAINYIWEKLVSVFMDTDTRTLMHQVLKLGKAAAHKPFNTNTSQHQTFLQATLDKIQALKKRHANLDFNSEIKVLQEQLNS